MSKLTFQRKMKSLFVVTLGGFGVFTASSLYRGDEIFYKNCVMPIVHLLDAERAHKLAVFVNKHRLLPKSQYKDPESLKVCLFGKEFVNPIGIAAGFDKDGEAIQGLQDIGFGFVEIGSVTPEPQPGNEKPRVFRLSEDSAVINRYGFNSQGHAVVLERIKLIKQSDFKGIIGVNLGKNKLSNDAINDYVNGVNEFGPFADYLVVNVSSPNTPGLRNMQHKEILSNLLKAVLTARNNIPNRPPVLLKLAPDLSHEERKDVVAVIEQTDCRVDGLIISNTTIQRPEFLLNKIKESGGLSGAPLKDISTEMISEMHKLTKKRIPIIGVGGISNGQDAFEKIRAGASVVQLYTAMIYDGPTIATKIKKELETLIKDNGFNNITEAVGTGVD